MLISTPVTRSQKDAHVSVKNPPHKRRSLKQLSSSEGGMIITPGEEDIAMVQCHFVLEEEAWDALWEVLEAPSRDLSGLRKLFAKKTVIEELEKV